MKTSSVMHLYVQCQKLEQRHHQLRNRHDLCITGHAYENTNKIPKEDRRQKFPTEFDTIC